MKQPTDFYRDEFEPGWRDREAAKQASMGEFYHSLPLRTGLLIGQGEVPVIGAPQQIGIGTMQNRIDLMQEEFDCIHQCLDNAKAPRDEGGKALSVWGRVLRMPRTPCGECHLQPGERCDICGAHYVRG